MCEPQTTQPTKAAFTPDPVPRRAVPYGMLRRFRRNITASGTSQIVHVDTFAYDARNRLYFVEQRMVLAISANNSKCSIDIQKYRRNSWTSSGTVSIAPAACEIHPITEDVL